MVTDDTLVHWLLGACSIFAAAVASILAWVGSDAMARLKKVEDEKQDASVAAADRQRDLDAAQQSRAELRGEMRDMASKMDSGFVRVFDKIDDLRNDITGRTRKPTSP